MKRWTVGLPLVLALMACSTTSMTGNVARPSPSAASSVAAVSPATSPVSGATPSAIATPTPLLSGAGPLAVLVDLNSALLTYTISLVDKQGNVVRQVTARKRSLIATSLGDAVVLPYVSTTATTLYYLDGNNEIKSLRLDGTPGPTMSFPEVDPARPAGELSFAVSPNDQVVAFAVIDFFNNEAWEVLYVRSFDGSFSKELFSTTSDFVWPVAWHGGLVVLAHPSGPYEESLTQAAPARDDPYSAISYHLVDWQTATRKVLMGACTVSGPLSPAGSGCIQGGSIDWQGNTTDWSSTDWGTRSSAAALSPDGQWMAAANPNDPTQMGIWRRSDGLMATYVQGPGLHDWAGWLDDQTIVIGSEGNDWQPAVVNVITGGAVHPVDAHGFVAGVFPANIT